MLAFAAHGGGRHVAGAGADRRRVLLVWRAPALRLVCVTGTAPASSASGRSAACLWSSPQAARDPPAGRRGLGRDGGAGARHGRHDGEHGPRPRRLPGHVGPDDGGDDAPRRCSPRLAVRPDLPRAPVATDRDAGGRVPAGVGGDRHPLLCPRPAGRPSRPGHLAGPSPHRGDPRRGRRLAADRGQGRLPPPLPLAPRPAAPLWRLPGADPGPAVWASTTADGASVAAGR